MLKTGEAPLRISRSFLNEAPRRASGSPARAWDGCRPRRQSPAVPRPCPSGSRRVWADTGGSCRSCSRCLPAACGVRVGEARVHAQLVAQARVAGSSGNGTRGLPPTGGGDQPRPGHSSTRAHRRSHDRRWRLRGLARLWPALRRAGPAMQHPPVHGPVFSRFGRYGRQDPFSSDGNPRVASGLPAGRRGVAAGHQTDPADAGAVADLDLDDLAFPLRQVRIYLPHRCDIPSDWLSGQSPI